MNYTDKNIVHSVLQKDDLKNITNAHKQNLLEEFTLNEIVASTRNGTKNNLHCLYNDIDLGTKKMEINPFLLLYEMQIPNSKSLEYFILIPSILSFDDLQFVSIPLGVIGKFFKSIFQNYATSNIFQLEEIISSTNIDRSSNQAVEKLSLAIKRLLYTHAIIIKEAETEKP